MTTWKLPPWASEIAPACTAAAHTAESTVYGPLPQIERRVARQLGWQLTRYVAPTCRFWRSPAGNVQPASPAGPVAGVADIWPPPGPCGPWPSVWMVQAPSATARHIETTDRSMQPLLLGTLSYSRSNQRPSSFAIVSACLIALLAAP